jgi:nitrogen fixation NifU-like protein
MSSELSDLYQELILDHKRHPRNFREMPEATRAVDGHNPLCGDHLRLYVHLDGDRIADVSFIGNGCAISVASASMLTENLKGKTVAEAETMFQNMHDLLTREDAAVDVAKLGKLGVLQGVRDYPTRVKCATLSWHTLKAALDSENPESVTTE